MSRTRNVPISLPEAKRYLDLSGVASDLRQVKKLCARFLEKHDAVDNPDWDDLEVLCVAAIVRYGRTFTSGVRLGVHPSMLSRLSAVDQEVHVLFKDLRDKWVAHSVNPFEDNQLIVWLAPIETNGPGVVGVAVQETRLTSLGPPDMMRLESLAIHLLEIVECEIAVERKKVTIFVREMNTVSFYALSEASPELPGNHLAGKARKQ